MKPSRMLLLIAPLALAATAARARRRPAPPAPTGSAQGPRQRLAVIATVEFLASDDDVRRAEDAAPRPASASTTEAAGRQQLNVSTALGALAFSSEGIRPKAGELWRVYGTVAPNGSLGTSICAGSVLMPRSPRQHRSLAAGKTKALVPASIAGKPHSGALPGVKLPKSGTLKLRAKSPAPIPPPPRRRPRCLVQPGHAARTLKVKWSGRVVGDDRQADEAEGRQEGRDARRRHARGVVRDRASASRLSFAARGSALIRASSRSAALRSGCAQLAASSTGRRLRV